jgi:hypothetical protein
MLAPFAVNEQVYSWIQVLRRVFCSPRQSDVNASASWQSHSELLHTTSAQCYPTVIPDHVNQWIRLHGGVFWVSCVVAGTHPRLRISQLFVAFRVPVSEAGHPSFACEREFCGSGRMGNSLGCWCGEGVLKVTVVKATVIGLN